MVLLNDDARAYLDKTDLLPTLEAGIEAILRDSDDTRDPVGALATWLMRNNPRHNAAFAAQIQQRRTEAAEAKAAAEAAVTAPVAAEAATSAAPAAPTADEPKPAPTTCLLYTSPSPRDS